jgi:hypothetical protein
VRVGKLARADESSAALAGIPTTPPAPAEQTADLFREAQPVRDSG